MATNRPFEYGRKDYIDRLNDLVNAGMTKVRSNPLDPDSAGVDVTASRQMKLGDNGCCADCRGAGIVITFAPECLLDGFSVCVNCISGGVTVNLVGLTNVFFLDTAAVTTKSVTPGNAAIISSDGIGFRIFRMGTV